MNQLTGWDERRAASIRALGPATPRIHPTSNANTWTPYDWKHHTIQIRQIAERFGLLFPVEASAYCPGSFTEVMLWRGETAADPVAVVLFGVEVGWVPELERERVLRRLRHAGAGTMRVFVPAWVWVSTKGDWGLSVEA